MEKVEAELQQRLRSLGFPAVRIVGRRGDQILYEGPNGEDLMDPPIARVVHGELVLERPYLPRV